jgi:hypothetical protein
MTMTIKEAIANVKQQIKEQEEIVAEYESKHTKEELENAVQYMNDFDGKDWMKEVERLMELGPDHAESIEFKKNNKLCRWNDAKRQIKNFNETLSIPLYYMHEAPSEKLVSPAGINPDTNIVALQSDYKNS